MFVHLALHIPEVEARDVKPDRASRGVKFHYHLVFGHSLLAAGAHLPVAWAAPNAWAVIVR